MPTTDITKIKIGKYMIGLVGFKDALKETADTYADQPDDTIARQLLDRLKKRNYIPQHVQKEYGQAFVREFRKFMGQPFTQEASTELEIKVLGAGCAVCDGLENLLMQVLAEMNLAADLEHVRDVEKFDHYNVTQTPALVINGKIMLAGKAPSKHQIKAWLQKAGIKQTSGGQMDKPVLIKNIPFSESQNLLDLVEYEEGRVVSRTFAQNPSVSLTLFAFDAGEGISAHTAPGDAMVQVLDGEALVNIDGTDITVCAGQVVVMPADVPHAVTAAKRFKMLLTVVKRPLGIQS